MTDRDAGYREGIEAELLPCPFCGNKNIRVCSNGIGDFYAICTGEDDEPHCGASCIEINCETEAKAVRRWNTRALPLPSTPDDGKAEPVAIKPLEWPDQCSRGRRVHCNPLLGGTEQYCIAHYGGDLGSKVYRWARQGGSWSGALHTYNEAKSATQADYEQRIRSALVRPSPADVAIREAAQFLAERLDEFDPGEDEAEREYHGHVAPALARLKSALSAHAGDAAKESGGGGNPAKTEPTEVAPGRGSMPPVSREHMLSSASAPPDTHAETISNQENFK